MQQGPVLLLRPRLPAGGGAALGWTLAWQGGPTLAGDELHAHTLREAADLLRVLLLLLSAAAAEPLP